jgi:4'-phosphopantetheinyl transferase
MSARDNARLSGEAGDTGGWLAGPQAPRLAQGSAHVWRADLDAVADDVLSGLSDDERERAGEISGDRERRAWTRSRRVLRALLGRYLRCAPGDVQLAVGPHGKPQLSSDATGDSQLFFNLSHSQQWALYAFSADGPVGVDVQALRDRGERTAVDHIAVARRAFGEHEAQRLSLVEPARREWEFLRAWTLHEARLKRLGLGIGGGGPAAPDIGVAGASAAGAGTPAGEMADAGAWTVELDVGRRAAAALALSSPTGDLRLWDWA